MWLFETRSDHQKDTPEGDVTPLVGTPNLDVIGCYHVDDPGHFKVGLPATEGDFLPGLLELGKPGFEGVGAGYPRASSLSGGSQSDRDRVQPRIEELGRGPQTEVVGAYRQQFSAPFVPETADRHSLPLMHGCVGHISEDCPASSLQLDQALDLLGLAPELGSHPTPEFFGKVVELLRLPSHLFRVLDTASGRARNVAATVLGAWGTREAR